MRQTFSTNPIDSGGHVAVFYESPSEPWLLLAEYFHTGFLQDELGILVVSASTEEAIEEFNKVGLDIRHQLTAGDLRIFDMTPTYLNNSRFVSSFMLNNVYNFIEDAMDSGYKGLRTAGEMNWLHQRPEFRPDAVVYEDEVNHVVELHPHFTGMCMYAVGHGNPGLLSEALHTHPSFVYRGEMYSNSANNKTASTAVQNLLSQAAN